MEIILKHPQYYSTKLNALDKQKEQIQRAEFNNQIEERLIAQRARILSGQKEIIEIKKMLIEVKSRLHDLSSL